MVNTVTSVHKLPTVTATQMKRTNPAHFGTAPLTGNGATNSVATSGVSFREQLTVAVSALNDQQLAVGRVEQQLITDPDSVDVHDVVTAMAKAQMSLGLAQTVIDRLVSGWNEISTTR